MDLNAQKVRVVSEGLLRVSVSPRPLAGETSGAGRGVGTSEPGAAVAEQTAGQSLRKSNVGSLQDPAAPPLLCVYLPSHQGQITKCTS